MRVLVDAQLPPALVRWLADKGHEAEHVADREMQAACPTNPQFKMAKLGGGFTMCGGPSRHRADGPRVIRSQH